MKTGRITVNHYEAWKISGISKTEYGHTNGISIATIYYWQRKTLVVANPSTLDEKDASEWLTVPVKNSSSGPLIEFSLSENFEFNLKIRISS